MAGTETHRVIVPSRGPALGAVMRERPSSAESAERYACGKQAVKASKHLTWAAGKWQCDSTSIAEACVSSRLNIAPPIVPTSSAKRPINRAAR